MCGIVGYLNCGSAPPPTEQDLRQMLAMIRHRGPDQFGIYLDDHAALGSARLSIVDVAGGQQPIPNEDGSLWIVFNGEVFNYLELRPELEARGHKFATQTDTEVILHLYEELGPDCLARLNGQFALAIYDAPKQSLFLARDRLGVRPLFYTQTSGALVFGSEIKALLADDRVNRRLDPVTLDQVFTFWCPLSPRTIFQGIQELPPGHYMLAGPGGIRLKQYWEIDFPEMGPARQPKRGNDTSETQIEAFRELLIDAVRMRLRADVPVGAYLSGGLDSSVVASIVQRFTSNRLQTFSIAFADANFDESRFQREMAEFLGTEHHVVETSHAEIGAAFPEVVWHLEVPVMRTAPVPMFLLSQLVHRCGFKVVLTGEGADEFLAGYDIFKEAAVRRFCARQPASRRRPLLFGRLYQDIGALARMSPDFLAAFFRQDLTKVDNPSYSHAVRWRNNRRTTRFFSAAVKDAVASHGPEAVEQIPYPPRFHRWGSLQQAQFLEISTFMSQYLLSSQGDRVALAHSVEGRFPFLDPRVVEFCNRLPASLKLRGLTEKYLLKRLGSELLPERIWRRPKRPYRAPIHRSFFGQATSDYVQELLSEPNIRQAGLFQASAISQLVCRAQKALPLSETDEMALTGIISMQLVHSRFMAHFRKCPSLSEKEPVKIYRGATDNRSDNNVVQPRQH